MRQATEIWFVTQVPCGGGAFGQHFAEAEGWSIAVHGGDVTLGRGDESVTVHGVGFTARFLPEPVPMAEPEPTTSIKAKGKHGR